MKTWDIFCRVVDNYGDIGVCWRFARQLATEYPFEVRLWVDDIHSLARICPDALSLIAPVSDIGKHIISGVDVQIWPENFSSDINIADVVIEAFACELPPIYLQEMISLKRKGNPPHWFNLEYLSAEDWVEGCHGLASMHPASGLKKTFFFPGFTHKTGGLLCEKSLLEERDHFQKDPQAISSFLSQLGVNPTQENLVISLFGYENTSVGFLLQSWRHSTTPIICLVPDGRILASINQALAVQLVVGDEIKLESLLIKVIPFLNQQDYDRLLWACDLNFVRGEDSFARAQWAAKPLVWHIYPQDEDFHLVKLNAFLDKYTQTMSAELANPIRALWLGWNQSQNCNQPWQEAISHYKNWSIQAGLWSNQLNSLGDLASNMVQFCQKTL